MLDDEEIYFEFLKIQFDDCEVQYESNPVAWLDRVSLEKTDLNEYKFIFCDYNFDNLSMNSFELNLSKYIREHGYKNYLILFSNLTRFNDDEMKNKEYFDISLDKGNLIPLNMIEEKCLKSQFKPVWEKRLRKNELESTL